MSNLRELKGAFSLISVLEDEDQIDSIICSAIEKNLDINELDVNEDIDDEYLYESYSY